MYFKSLIGSLLFWPYYFIASFPKRLIALLKHLFVVPFSKFERNHYNRQKLSPLKKSLGGISWWIATLFSKIIDLSGLWEIMDVMFSLFKFNTRQLTEFEISEAKKVFGDSLPYSAIRIDENSLFAWIGAKSEGKSQLGMVTFRTVNFTRKLKCEPGNLDSAWLIHELVHVLQMQSLGAQYLYEALYAQKTSGYGYGGQSTLREGHKLHHFNLEQQAEIARHYYKYCIYGDRDPQVYGSYIAALQKGQF